MRRLEKVIRIRKLSDPALDREDLEYWLSLPPAERVAEVDRLRWEAHGGPLKITKVVRVFSRRTGAANE